MAYEINATSNNLPELAFEAFGEVIAEMNKGIPSTDAISEYTLRNVELWGTPNEFCAVYSFDGICGLNNPTLTTAESSTGNVFFNAIKTVRIKKASNSKYDVIAQGGGPLSYGLKKADVDSCALPYESVTLTPIFASDGCSIHTGLFHSIDNRLIDYVGVEKMDAFIDEYGYGEENNIVNFVKFCGISKDTFATLIDQLQLNATASYSGGNGYNADVIYSGDDTTIQQYYARSDKQSAPEASASQQAEYENEKHPE